MEVLYKNYIQKKNQFNNKFVLYHISRTIKTPRYETRFALLSKGNLLEDNV